MIDFMLYSYWVLFQKIFRFFVVIVIDFFFFFFCGVTANTPSCIFKGAFKLTALKWSDVAVTNNVDLVYNMTDLFQIPFLSDFASMDIAHFDQHVFSYLNFVKCKLTQSQRLSMQIIFDSNFLPNNKATFLQFCMCKFQVIYDG